MLIFNTYLQYKPFLLSPTLLYINKIPPLIFNHKFILKLYLIIYLICFLNLMGFVIRCYEESQLSDKAQVIDLERRCQIGQSKRVFLFTDNLGDPICRIRNSPMYKMLVAEWDKEVVGVIQGSIKAVFLTAHKPPPPGLVVKVGYILGLRVAPPYRRRGIGSGLVRRLEDWFVSNDVDYCCMATEKDNHASLNLFINNLRYIKFRTGRILVDPVRNRPYNINSSEINIQKLKIEEAEAIYKKHMASTEFFPKDIKSILKNKLSLGTWMANFKQPPWLSPSTAVGGNRQITTSSWAIASLWNSGEVFKLRLGKAPFPWLIYTKSLKIMDKILPCFKLVLVPDFFKPFGFYFVYGLHHEGPFSERLVGALCKFVHNVALKNNSRDSCKAIVTEIGGDEDDELKMEIPHWKLLSCYEDFWCIKSLRNNNISNDNDHDHDHHILEWTNAPPNRTLFVDPREV
ncbi:probable N-acetyltransferase HLS1-like [Benincasa hispida]|uniref:probable N-acetyltransferase HLS1-like n=1 Tax=Benincasa hispida TaxID=102211 RepID=UPI0019025F05|nr:probable N-acetyltransferase HLS1-like [Benincasa hispida]